MRVGKNLLHGQDICEYGPHEKPCAWKGKTIILINKKAFLANGKWNTDGKGNRLLISYIGINSEFVEGGFWMFQSKKIGNYHVEMDGDYFKDCFSKILPLLKDNCLIMLDNVSYHSQKLEKFQIHHSKKKKHGSDWKTCSWCA